jgi:uncharacterized membrane protein YeaQ/YmgE (transglycosylase-associated protein family)
MLTARLLESHVTGVASETEGHPGSAPSPEIVFDTTEGTPITKYLRRWNMSILAWIVLGLIAGFIGSKLVNKTGEGVFLDIVLGIVGAVVGGWVFSMFGAHGVTGVNLYSLIVAVIGAVLVLVVYHAVRGGRARA